MIGNQVLFWDFGTEKSYLFFIYYAILYTSHFQRALRQVSVQNKARIATIISYPKNSPHTIRAYALNDWFLKGRKIVEFHVLKG